MNSTKTILLCAALSASVAFPTSCAHLQPEGTRPPCLAEKCDMLHNRENIAEIETGERAMRKASNAMPFGKPCPDAPANPGYLGPSVHGDLYVGETKADAVFNAEERKRDSETPLRRNSLFLRRTSQEGTEEWREVLTTGSEWRLPDDATDWERQNERDLKECFDVMMAHGSSDGRALWLVCNPHTCTYFLVCRYDIRDGILRILCDGDSAAAIDGLFNISWFATAAGNGNPAESPPETCMFFWRTIQGQEVDLLEKSAGGLKSYMEPYRQRIVDALLSRTLESKGAVLLAVSACFC